MTLSFSAQWPAKMGDLAGQPNYFIEKIWAGLLGEESIHSNDYIDFQDAHKTRFKYDWDTLDIKDFLNAASKIHTIRTGNRWRPGMKIHPVINNRTKNRFQFAPVLECKSVQEIEIHYVKSAIQPKYGPVVYHQEILIDGCIPKSSTVLRLAINDGFPSVEAFFCWFDKDFQGQIVHWTQTVY